LIALALAVGLTAAAVYLTCVPRVSASGFRSRVEAELPPGTPRDRVEAWLRAEGLSFLPVVDEDRRPVGLCGAVTDVYRVELLGRTELRFAFYFDSDEKLVEFSLSEFTYCL
jgi:hypothetical protein